MKFYSFMEFLVFEKKIVSEEAFNNPSEYIKKMWSKYKDEYIYFCKKNNYLREEF